MPDEGAPRVKIVCFDFDNTLLLSERCKQEVMREVVRPYPGGEEVIAGVCIDARLAPPGVAVTRHTIFRDVARGLVAKGTVCDAEEEALGRRLCDEFTVLAEKRLMEAEEVPGAVELLAHLSAHGVPCYINTATPQEPITAVVQKLGWTRYFAGVLGTPRSKLENLHTAARDAGLPSEGNHLVVMVGDGDNDCRAACDFGCPFIGVELPGHEIENAGHAFSAPCVSVVRDMHDAGVVLCSMLGIPPVGSASRSGARAAKEE